MKTEGQVRHKLQQVTYRHLQRAIRTALSRRPENCVHNQVVRLPKGEMRFCDLRGEDCDSYVPCDENHGGIDQASRCIDFVRVNTKESVKEEFEVFLKTADMAAIAVEYPDIVALLWVLDVGGADVVTDMDLSVDPDADPPPPPEPPPRPAEEPAAET